MIRGVPRALLFTVVTVVAAALATASGCGNADSDVGTEQMELAAGATYGAGNTVQAERVHQQIESEPSGQRHDDGVLRCRHVDVLRRRRCG